MNDSIYKSIKTLPPLDDTVIKIQQICRDENAAINLRDLGIGYVRKCTQSQSVTTA